MTCTRCRALLSRYHDGELDRATREQMRDHLLECERCRAHLAAFEQMEEAIRGALRVTPGPRTERAAAIAPGAIQERCRPARARRLQVMLGGMAGACTAALIVLALIVTGSISPQRRQLAHGPVVPVRPSARTMPAQAVAEANSAVVPPPTAARPRPRKIFLVRSVPAPALTRARATQLAHTRTIVTTTPPPSETPRRDRASFAQVLPLAHLGSEAIHMPVWSNDSTSLLYLTEWEPDPVSTWYSGTLYRYAPSGDVMLHRLVRNYAWSTDGSHIIYAAQAAGRADREAQELHLAGANGSDDHVLCGVDRANIAYIGNQIFAVQHGTVVAIDPATGTSSALTDVPALIVPDESVAFWAISADLRFFAYQDRNGLRIWDRQRLGLLVTDQPLARLGEAGFHFSWDGDTVFYSTFDGRRTMLYRQRLAPAEPARALNAGQPLPSPILAVGPVSADGARLGFIATSQGGTRGYVIDTEHGSAHPVLPPDGVGPVYGPAPDGTRFAYTLYRGNDVVASGLARLH